MKEETYIICTATVDGWGMGDPIYKSELKDYLETLDREAEECGMKVLFCSSYQEFNPEYCQDNLMKVLLIKGKVVVPQPKEKVITYEVE